MHIKDLTKEQAIEIAKLQYPFHEFIKSDFDFHYDDGNRGAWVDVNEEMISISFKVEENIEPKKKDIHVHIYPSLDVSVGIYEWNGTFWKHVESRGTCNQFMVQSKFKEWNIYPKGKEFKTRNSKTMLEWSDKTEALYLKTFGQTSLKGRLQDILNESLELNRYTNLQNLREEYGDLLSSALMGIREAGLDPDVLLTENHDKIKRREQQYISMGRKLKVAIFGGAFNPIHKGHIQVAQSVLRAAQAFDEVWLMPCYKHMYGKNLLDADMRLEMCRLAASIDGRIKVCDYEVRNQMAGPTFNLMNRMIVDPIYKDTHEFSCIIGLDNANSFSQWVDSEELERLVRFVVVPRKGVKRDPSVTWYLKSPHMYLTDEVPILECSSTEVKKIFETAPCGQILQTIQKYLSDPVIKYISEHKLYGSEHLFPEQLTP